MSPAALKALGGLFAAFAVVLNAAAAGHLDPIQIGEAVFAFAAVVTMIEGAVKSHSTKLLEATHPSGGLTQ